MIEMIDFEALQKKIAVPSGPIIKGDPNSMDQQVAFRKLIISGRRIMYGKATAHFMKSAISGSDPIDKKLAGGTVNLMMLLYAGSNKTIPPNLLFPVAQYLFLEAADYAQKIGINITPQLLASAQKEMIFELSKRFTRPQQGNPAKPQPQTQPAQQGILSQGN